MPLSRTPGAPAASVTDPRGHTSVADRAKPSGPCKHRTLAESGDEPTVPGSAGGGRALYENSHAQSRTKTTERRVTASPRGNSALSWHCCQGAATVDLTGPASGETQTPRAKRCAVACTVRGTLDTGTRDRGRERRRGGAGGKVGHGPDGR